MKKRDIMVLFILLLLMLLAITLHEDQQTETGEPDTHRLVLEESEIQPLPLSAGIENVIFSYSQKGIASIEKNTVKALAPGHTTVTAVLPSDNKILLILEVFVVNTPVLTAQKQTIGIGETEEIFFSDAVGADRSAFIWESENPEIASVNDNFEVTGNSLGKTVISATYKNDPSVKASLMINVKKSSINTIDRLINIAMNEAGIEEGWNNDTKYGEWYGANNQEWCAIFVSWAAHEAGISTSVIPKFASVGTGKEFFEDRGLFRYSDQYTPKKGDIIFFLNGISHTGIVTKVKDGRVYVIEGNSLDMVGERNYSLSDSTITGYGTPRYE